MLYFVWFCKLVIGTWSILEVWVCWNYSVIFVMDSILVFMWMVINLIGIRNNLGKDVIMGVIV